MTVVIGSTDSANGPTARLGSYRALDGSRGVAVALDVDRPHAALVVGKRGYGKSYTLGVIAEGLARTSGIAPVIVDPMGAFRPIVDPVSGDADPVPARLIESPSVPATALDPRSWCELLELPPSSGAGSLVWRATAVGETLSEMRDHVAGSDAPLADRRAAINHFDLAETWNVFDPEGLAAAKLGTSAVTVLDVSALSTEPMNAVVRAVADLLYRRAVAGEIDRLPWLLVDEAHAFFEGVAGPGLRRLLTRGRTPGTSLVLATQRPSVVPEVALSQSDILLAHRLTTQSDIDALSRARPTYVDASLAEHLPTETGDVVVVDDATETVHRATIRTRHTPHGGQSPTVSELSQFDPETRHT